MLTKKRSSKDFPARCARPWLGRVILATGFAVTALCFARAMPVTPLVAGATPWHDTRHLADAGSDKRSQDAAHSLGYVTKNIEDIRVGDRVLADNPDIDSPTETEVNPATWRKLILRAEERWQDGTIDDINVETLQPPDWIEHHNAGVGVLVPLPLDLVEMGLPDDLRAEVIGIEPCPPIRPGSGRVVLTTVNHLNNYVLELTVRNATGQETTIRPTAFHKFYRLNDGIWVSAQHLRTSDRLRGLRDSISVVMTRRIGGTHRVYNLTVEGEHVYDVSNVGILVHNQGCHGPPPDYPRPPGWNNNWDWRPPSGDGPGAWRWWDPDGGEWRWHPPDRWHSEGHWDHNSWDEWNSPWENIPVPNYHI